MTSYPALEDVTTGGPTLGVGDYITSPSNVYYGLLNNEGSFNLYYGSDPVTSGNIESTPLGGPVRPASGASYAPFAQVNQGTFASGASVNNSPVVTFQAGATSGGQPAFATVSDAGQLIVTSGTPTSPGTQLSSVGATGPVTGIALTSLNYETNKATINANGVTGTTQSCSSSTIHAQSCSLGLSYNYTQTQSWDWELSNAVSAGVTTTASVQAGVPDIATVSGSVALDVSETTSLTNGQSGSTSTSETFSSTTDLTVDPFSEYNAAITAIEGTYSVPYTFTGIATYQSGATAPVSGTGTFNGGDTTGFAVAITCVVEENGPCPTGPGATPGLGTPVPEPSSLLLVPVALLAVTAIRLPALVLLAVAAIRGVRPAHSRARRRSVPGSLKCYGAGGGGLPSAAL